MDKNSINDRPKAQLATGIVAYALGFDLNEMMSGARGSRETCTARQVAMYLTYTSFEMSLSRCAYAFDRDRSTVAHACQIIENRRDQLDFDQWVEGLEEVLKQLIPYQPKFREAG